MTDREENARYVMGENDAKVRLHNIGRYQLLQDPVYRNGTDETRKLMEGRKLTEAEYERQANNLMNGEPQRQIDLARTLIGQGGSREGAVVNTFPFEVDKFGFVSPIHGHEANYLIGRAYNRK